MLPILLPIGALIVLLWGLLRKRIYYVISSIWLSLITLIIHYQNAGREILGNYFNYTNTLLCTLSLLVFISAILYASAYFNIKKKTPLVKYLATLMQATIVLACIFLLANLWLNAYFLANRLEGTPIIQVALMKKPSYCNYKYVFYKITVDGSTDYLCPNYFGFIPKMGHLSVSPEFIMMQMSLPNKRRLLLLQQKKKVD
jgi:hypothetical protein